MGGGFLMLHGKHGRTPLFGPVDGLVQLHGSSSVEVTRPARVKKSVALSGRVSVQRGPEPRREWAVSVESAYPEHVQLLQGVEYGAYGPGPFVWYDELAQVTNMLTPGESMLRAGSWTGGAFGGAGVAADKTPYLVSRTADVGASVFLSERIAVPAEMPVTVSAYVSTHPTTAATLRVREWDPEGVFFNTHTFTVPAGTHAGRAVVSFKTSVRTRTLSFNILDPLMVTMPAVTLTDKALPWATGLGCRSAVVELPGHSVGKAVAHPNGRRMGYSMTIHELG
jgi:hypothetical protein